jgi:hypothetical protein
VASANSLTPDTNPRFQTSPTASVNPNGLLEDFTVQHPGLRAGEHLLSFSSCTTPIQQSTQAPALEDRVGCPSLATQTRVRRCPGIPASINSTQEKGDLEAALLTSFVTDVVPWIVSTCPGSRFANSVISLAERQPTVRGAMTALVKARNKAIYAGNDREGRGHHGDRYLDTIEGELGHVDDTPATNVTRSLLSVARLFGSRPAHWRKVKGTYLPSKGGFEEPLRYLLQMQGKIGKFTEVDS